MIAHYRKHKNFYSLFPKPLAWQLCAYSSSQGPLSAYIAKILDKKCKIKKMDRVLSTRIQLLNCQVEYAMRLKHSHYPCFFPLGFKNPKGFKNKLIYTYVLVKDHSLFKRTISYIRTNLSFIPIWVIKSQSINYFSACRVWQQLHSCYYPFNINIVYFYNIWI